MINKLTYLFLEKSPTGIFSIGEVASALGGTADSRQALLKRAVKDGQIMRIRRGLYCLSTSLNKLTINPLVAAQYIYGPSYLSFETALSYHQWIPEAVYSYANVCNKKSKEFDTPIGLFSYKRVPQNILYSGVDRIVLDNKTTFLIASPLKAMCDYVYYNRLDWQSIAPIITSLRVEEENIQNITLEEIDEQLRNYTSLRVHNFLDGLKKDLIQ